MTNIDLEEFRRQHEEISDRCGQLQQEYDKAFREAGVEPPLETGRWGRPQVCSTLDYITDEAIFLTGTEDDEFRHITFQVPADVFEGRRTVQEWAQPRIDNLLASQRAAQRFALARDKREFERLREKLEGKL